MAEEVKVKGPVSVQPASPEAVAFWLLEKIHYYELDSESKQGSREYWLGLYEQCLRATKGYKL